VKRDSAHWLLPVRPVKVDRAGPERRSAENFDISDSIGCSC